MNCAPLGYLSSALSVWRQMVQSALRRVAATPDYWDDASSEKLADQSMGRFRHRGENADGWLMRFLCPKTRQRIGQVANSFFPQFAVVFCWKPSHNAEQPFDLHARLALSGAVDCSTLIVSPHQTKTLRRWSNVRLHR